MITNFGSVLNFNRASAGGYFDSTGKFVWSGVSKNLLKSSEKFQWSSVINCEVLPFDVNNASLGKNLIQNGDFSLASAHMWTGGLGVVNGTASVSSNSLQLTVGSSDDASARWVYKLEKLQIGRYYKFSFSENGATGTGDRMTVWTNSSNGTGGQTLNQVVVASWTNETKTYYVKPWQSTMYIAFGFVSAAVGNTINISNIQLSLVEEGDISFDSVSSASVIIPSKQNTNHYILNSASYTGTYTASIHVKKYGYETFAIGNLAQTKKCEFNLTSKSVTTTGVGVTGGIVDLGNGWLRIYITANMSAENFVFYPYSSSAFAGDGVSGLLIYGAQIEAGSVMTSYVKLDTDNHTPRFEYDRNTLEPLGILLEKQSTNLLTYSQQYTDASWNKIGTTTATNDAVGLDEISNSAGTIFMPSASDWLWKSFSGAANTQYTFSVWLSGSGTIDIGIYDSVTGGNNRTQIALTATLTRYTFTATTAVASSDFRVYIARVFSGTTTATSFNIWGAQLEAGSYATSYIPTTTSQITRSKDSLNLNLFTYLKYYNSKQFTILIDAVSLNDNYGSCLLGFGYFSASVSRNTTGLGKASWWNEAVALESNNEASWKGGVKVAAGFDANSRKLCMNGGAVSTDTNPPNATNIDVYNVVINSSGQNGSSLDGYVRKILFYPYLLSDAELMEITQL